MKNGNLATDVFEYLMKKIRALWALFLVLVMLLIFTNCAWASTYFRSRSKCEEYRLAQEVSEIIIPDASPDGKRKRGK